MIILSTLLEEIRTSGGGGREGRGGIINDNARPRILLCEAIFVLHISLPNKN